MKTILVPTDFSKNASNALNYAISIAKKEKAKIILLHAYNIVYLSSDMPIEYFAEELFSAERAAKKQLDALSIRVNKSGLKCETINKQGAPVDIIIDSIKNKKPEFIVMGTKGASGIKEVFMGSNTAKVIAKATCPVIAVPERASFDGMKKIAYATNYSFSNFADLKQLVNLAKIFKSRIKLIHVADKEYTQRDYMTRFTEKVKQKVKYKYISAQLLESTDIEKKLEQYIKKESVSILAVSTKHRNLIERLFEKSITQKLAFHTKVPLLAFHHKQESVILI